MATPDENAMERLHKAVLGADPTGDTVDADEDTYPNTPAERVNYAAHCATMSLTHLARAINRLHRLDGFLTAAKGELPKIILHNEAKVAYKYLCGVEDDINDAVDMIERVMDDSGEVPHD